MRGQLQNLADGKGVRTREPTVTVSCLAIAVLVLKHNLRVTADQLAGLLSAMAVLPDAENRTCPGYTLLEAEFGDPRCDKLAGYRRVSSVFSCQSLL